MTYQEDSIHFVIGADFKIKEPKYLTKLFKHGYSKSKAKREVAIEVWNELTKGNL